MQHKLQKLRVKFNKLFHSQFFRFLLVGGFCTLQNIFWLYLLTTILGLHYIVSTIILMITVNSLGFYLNNRYTFKHSDHSFQSFIKKLLKYHTVMFSSFLTILVLMFVLVDIFKIWYLLANILITIGITIYNFTAHKKWTFK
jgi:putative flippase GtrA